MRCGGGPQRRGWVRGRTWSCSTMALSLGVNSISLTAISPPVRSSSPMYTCADTHRRHGQPRAPAPGPQRGLDSPMASRAVLGWQAWW